MTHAQVRLFGEGEEFVEQKRGQPHRLQCADQPIQLQELQIFSLPDSLLLQVLDQSSCSSLPCCLGADSPCQVQHCVTMLSASGLLLSGNQPEAYIVKKIKPGTYKYKSCLSRCRLQTSNGTLKGWSQRGCGTDAIRERKIKAKT